MTKRNRRKFGISRRLGVSLWGKGKDPFTTRNYPPGMHGMSGYRKLTDYGMQLRAKQKLRGYYGNITEKQFVNTYKEALRRKGDTSEHLIGLLESRLDAFIYRAKFSATVFSARQLVNHKHVQVNGVVVNIPSYKLKAGDRVEIRERSKSLEVIQTAMSNGARSIPDYVELDTDKLLATYKRVPAFADVPYPITMEPHLIIEFYSR